MLGGGRRDEQTSPLISLVLPLQYHCLSFPSRALEDQEKERKVHPGSLPPHWLFVGSKREEL